MIRSPLLALLALVVAALAFPSPASAHAEYKSSVPAKGAILTGAPAQVEITFTEDIRKTAGTYDIQVNRDRGALATAGPAVIDESDPSKVSVPLKANLVPGRYVVRWKNVSDGDGDPEEGGLSFYVKTQPTAVDLVNDEQLASIGAEDQTPGAATPTAAAGGSVTAPAATSGAPTSSGAAPTAEAAPSSGTGGSNAVVYVIVGVLAVASILTAGAWWVFARRRS